MPCFSFPSLPSFQASLSFESDSSLSLFQNGFQGGQYLLSLCTENEGQNKFLIRDRLFLPRAGDALLIPPYCYQHFIKGNGLYRETRILFDPSVAEALCPNATACMQNGNYIFSFHSARKYSSIIERDDPSLSLTTILSLLAEVEESSKNKAAFRVQEPLPQLLQKSLSYLLFHYNEKVSGSFLAARYGVSAKTVDELFRKILGLSVGRLREQLQYIKATELLACGLAPNGILPVIGAKDEKALHKLLDKYS